MIIKVEKPFCDLKIGLLGFRHDLLEKVLKEFKVDNYSVLVDYQQIDSSLDLVFLSGVHYILPEESLNKSTYGVYCFHESPLPEGRGSAPIQWAVSNKRPNLTVSLFKANTKIDKGYIVTQINMPVLPSDVYEQLEIKRRVGIQKAFKVMLEELQQGVIVLREQTGSTSYNKKRTAKDSELSVDKSLKELWDEIRVCDNDKFPAYFILNNKKITLTYKVEDLNDHSN